MPCRTVSKRAGPCLCLLRRTDHYSACPTPHGPSSQPCAFSPGQTPACTGSLTRVKARPTIRAARSPSVPFDRRRQTSGAGRQARIVGGEILDVLIAQVLNERLHRRLDPHAVPKGPDLCRKVLPAAGRPGSATTGSPKRPPDRGRRRRAPPWPCRPPDRRLRPRRRCRRRPPRAR